MSRLLHSFEGLWRSMQTSHNSLFVFVEGDDPDRVFYSNIVDIVCSSSNINYEVITAHDITDTGGGKLILLKFFSYLKSRSSLIDRRFGKITAAVFFLDKDVDDYRRTKNHSPHIIYTQWHEVENYLFMHGNICLAACTSSSLSLPLLRNGLGNIHSWRKRAATIWKDWAKLCLFANTKNINTACSYSQKCSQINDGYLSCGCLNSSKYLAHLSMLEGQSSLTPDQFRRSFKRLSTHIDELYNNDEYDIVFKGRWYVPLLMGYITKIAATKHYQHNGLDKKILSCLLTTINFNETWVDYFKDPLEQIISQSNL